eukprot:CAMPEP_0197189500 /NCGR_PEP_ID=MMETSP1423-20130617/19842_1 /TAXON_ID=476441 /ORGANISM="Pseudo-nitzschia heimii, Strain UNC1101" /LENGTH=779 /DNA_ID=CAMNT_0042641623 /DNA_START=83 /DNA_END=2422 /DNA_ORIENTATION=+
MDKKMRKRMAMIKNEQNRAFNAQYGTISSAKSFEEIKDEREAVIGRDYNASDDERDNTCDSGTPADSIIEMRRRRIYETTYRRRYPVKSTKKKPTFWKLEEELARPALLQSPSFLYVDKDLTVSESTPHSTNELYQQELSCSTKSAKGRILWKVETNNLRHNFEAVVVNDSDEHQMMKESSINDEITDCFGYEDDEIMTPVRMKKFIDLYDDMNNDSMERESFGNDNVIRSAVNEATVAEISTATQALALFVTSAVDVMKEAKTPEKNEIGENWTPNFQTAISETNNDKDTSGYEGVCEGAVTPFTALKLFKDKALAMTATPANKLITKIQTPLTTNTFESNIEETEVIVTKLGPDDKAETDHDAEKLDHGVLWSSLFDSSEAGSIDLNQKAILEALVEGGALHQQIDGTNMLKLFVDMYNKDTFERIVCGIQELKGLQGLVICRAVDRSRPTYRTDEEIESLFHAMDAIMRLESLMLLNFDSSSMMAVAMMINEHSSLYRLQIQLLDGTLNGEILGVLATAPKLTHVSLDLKESCSLGTILNSKSLESICVNSRLLELKKSHVRTLVYSLQSNFTLTTLDLGPPISLQHFQYLCSTLQQNYRLESLRVNLDLQTEEDSKTAAIELANLFRVNKYLLNVWNYSYQSCNISAMSKYDLLEALRGNKSMQELKFFAEDIGDWKDSRDGNTLWMKPNLTTPATKTSTIYEGTKGNDENTSIYSSLASTVGFESFRGDDTMPICGIDCSTFSPPFDCTSVKEMSANFQKWAAKNTRPGRRMEV